MSDLKRVQQLAALMVSQQATVVALIEQLDAAKKALTRTEQEDLPELMAEVGLKSLTLEDGSIVEVVQDVSCGITEERRALAHSWLLEHGFGGLIKTEVSVAFGRGERDQATLLAAKIQEDTGASPAVKEAVHPATLKSFVKEQMELGVAIPFDVFGIHPFNKAKLKAAKK